MATVKEVLEEAIEQAKGVEAGTVVCFERQFKQDVQRLQTEATTYTYAALFINNRWYITGGRDGGSDMSNADFMELLATNKHITNARVATAFEDLAV